MMSKASFSHSVHGGWGLVLTLSMWWVLTLPGLGIHPPSGTHHPRWVLTTHGYMDLGYYRIRLTSRWYASYWNAFLSQNAYSCQNETYIYQVDQILTWLRLTTWTHFA